MKVYRDRESGMPKGDGLVTYLKDPSVGYPPHMQTNLCCVLFFLRHVYIAGMSIRLFLQLVVILQLNM